MLGAPQPLTCNGARTVMPRFGDAVVAVNHVVAPGCNLGQKDRA